MYLITHTQTDNAIDDVFSETTNQNLKLQPNKSLYFQHVKQLIRNWEHT